MLINSEFRSFKSYAILDSAQICGWFNIFNFTFPNGNKGHFVLRLSYSFLVLPSNWSIEQFKPIAWLSLMKAGSGKIDFNATKVEVPKGRRRASLLVNVAPTILSATYSGVRIGMSLLFKIINRKCNYFEKQQST